ncbi:hypothetical protein XH96_04785 [Bradyrhizobium sp. CCBAU 51765]|nr:hypothetical protein XH96_04785 [Bradyrhizobium sp. CCBAU 51765]
MGLGLPRRRDLQISLAELADRGRVGKGLLAEMIERIAKIGSTQDLAVSLEHGRHMQAFEPGALGIASHERKFYFVAGNGLGGRVDSYGRSAFACLAHFDELDEARSHRILAGVNAQIFLIHHEDDEVIGDV